MFRDPPLWDSFVRIVRQRPDAIAVRHDGAALTFAELAARATTLAARVDAAAGNAAGGFVGVLVSDRIHLVAAMLGAVSAGRGFVMLDPDDPPERRRFILADCDAVALLVDDVHHDHAVVAPATCPVLDVAAPWPSSAPTRRSPASADPPAYICYTSGSTGKPKGVVQTQANLLFFARAYAATLGISPADRLSLLYTPGFSAILMDVFGGLLHGGTLCGYDVRHAGVAGLADWIDRAGVTVLHTVPTVFRRLCGTLPPGRILAGVRAIDLGGEAVTAHDAALVRDRFSAACVCWNHLAATEASVIAHYALQPAADADRAGLLPVGTPPPGVEVRIERDDGTPARPGEAGRIVIASPHVSPGYWRLPELDARHFAPDPSRPGWRLFRTDDVGRLDDEGLLHFSGRRGSRVKLRGHSIDLAEVEAAVRSCADVRDAAVVEARDADGEVVRLEAHVVPSIIPGDLAALRRALLDRLPAFMVPAVIQLRDALPETASGKIDRGALGGPTADAPPTEPMSPRERQVADVFAAILAAGAVGPDTDFFAAGGDSLSAVDLLARLSAALGRSVPQRLLLEHPTVGGLAAALDRLPAPATEAGDPPGVIVPLRTVGRHPPLFLVHGRLGQAHASPQLLAALGAEQPLYGIQARGLDGDEQPHRTLESMAADYTAAIRAVRPHGPYLLGGLCIGSYVAVLVAQTLRQAGAEVLPLILFDPKPPARRRWLCWTGADVRNRGLISARLAQRSAAGQIQHASEDPQRLAAAVDVALAFERAFARHAPRPYDGDVILLASRERLSPKHWGDPRVRAAVFRGTVHVLEVGSAHAGIFDARNPLFAQRVADGLALAHGASRPTMEVSAA